MIPHTVHWAVRGNTLSIRISEIFGTFRLRPLTPKRILTDEKRQRFNRAATGLGLRSIVHRGVRR
jgi:hypothetical protein